MPSRLPPPPTTPPPRPLAYGRTAPGAQMANLGDRMRQETSSALEQLLKHGSFATGLEPLIKAALAMETPVGMGAGILNKFKQAPAALGEGFSSVGRGIRGALPGKGTLGLAALGAGGALAYGIHRQNQQDRQNYPLVYAPMQGSYY